MKNNKAAPSSDWLAIRARQRRGGPGFLSECRNTRTVVRKKKKKPMMEEYISPIAFFPDSNKIPSPIKAPRKEDKKRDYRNKGHENLLKNISSKTESKNLMWSKPEGKNPILSSPESKNPMWRKPERKQPILSTRESKSQKWSKKPILSTPEGNKQMRNTPKSKNPIWSTPESKNPKWIEREIKNPMWTEAEGKNTKWDEPESNKPMWCKNPNISTEDHFDPYISKEFESLFPETPKSFEVYEDKNEYEKINIPKEDIKINDILIARACQEYNNVYCYK